MPCHILRSALSTPLLAALLLAGCPTGPDDNDGASDSTVDVLWIVDSSNSMHQDQQNLQASYGSMLDAVAASGVAVDYQMGVTTTQSMPCQHDVAAFADCADSCGNTGRLRGLDNADQDTSLPPTFLRPGDPDLEADFQALVDVGIYGSTEEHGLWVLAETICASLELPYASDFTDWNTDTPHQCSGGSWDMGDPLAGFCHCLPPVSEDYNIDAGGERFLRGQGTLMAVIVSDEGDFTPLMGTNAWPWSVQACDLSRPGSPWPSEIQDSCAGNPAALCENYCKLDLFLQFFSALDQEVVISVIGPGAALTPDGPNAGLIDVFCNEQNSALVMAEFYLWAAYLTGGIYRPMNEWNDVQECMEDADYDEVMGDLGQLLVDLGG